MRYILLALLVSYFAGRDATVQAHDDCDAILNQGVFKIIQMSERDHFEEKHQQWLETVTRSEVERCVGAGGNVVLPIDGVPVPIGGHLDSKAWDRFEAERKSGSIKQISEAQLVESYEKTGDREIIRAWLECRLHASMLVGLRWSVHPNGDQIVLKFSFRPTLGGDKVAKVTGEVSVVNARTTTSLKGLEVGETEQAINFTVIDPTQSVTIVINTNKGVVLVMEPPRLAPVRLPTIVVPNTDAWVLTGHAADFDILSGAFCTDGAKLELLGGHPSGSGHRVDFGQLGNGKFVVGYWADSHTYTDFFKMNVRNVVTNEEAEIQVTVHVVDQIPVPKIGSSFVPQLDQREIRENLNGTRKLVLPAPK